MKTDVIRDMLKEVDVHILDMWELAKLNRSTINLVDGVTDVVSSDVGAMLKDAIETGNYEDLPCIEMCSRKDGTARNVYVYQLIAGSIMCIDEDDTREQNAYSFMSIATNDSKLDLIDAVNYFVTGEK